MTDDKDLKTRRLAASETPAKKLSLTEGVLVVLEGPDRGRTIPVRPPGLRLGLNEDNDVVLGDDAVSKHHLRIEEAGGAFLLKDLDSTNGTFLDENRIREAYLKPGSLIRIGTTLMKFQPPGDAVAIEPSEETGFGELLGRSPKMREIFAILQKIVPTDLPVLLHGETGTGKEVAARSIHQMSRRKDGPYEVFDASTVSRDLIESSLFGHLTGAFTGATAQRKGAFLCAHGGTLFLDEIGELPLDLQSKLLRVLETGDVRPLGSDQVTKVNVRLIAATHRDIERMVREGSFRRDLYYRISAVTITLPPLRERIEDLSLITKRIFEAAGAPDQEILNSGRQKLYRHRWEGNVRELKNVLLRAIAFAAGGPIGPDHLDFGSSLQPALPEGGGSSGGGKASLREVEAQAIQETLDGTGWNKSEAARILDITRKTLQEKIERYGLKPRDR